MIKSMTGYGRSEKQFDDYRINVEIKTINNRYLDYSLRVYKQYSFIEEMVRECVSSNISRGKVDISIQFDNVKKDDRIVTLNEDVAREYYNALNELGDKFTINKDISVSTMSTFSDIFTIEKKEQDKEKITADIKEVLMSALNDLNANRQREGERLAAFFTECIAYISEIVSVIEERSPVTVNEYKERLRQRIEEILDGVQVDENRLLTEVAVFADKVNITEEIVRFKSHLQEFSLLLDSEKPVGRKLDFIIQELNREANTMGSKCNDFCIGKSVVELKSEIEKLREQVQNIE